MNMLNLPVTEESEIWKAELHKGGYEQLEIYSYPIWMVPVLFLNCPTDDSDLRGGE